MPGQIKRPIGITLLALPFLWIGCLGTLMIPVLLYGASPSIFALVSQSIHSRALSLFITCVIMTVWAGMYVLYAFLGYGLWKLRSWALKATVVINWSTLAMTVITVAVLARSDLWLSLFIGITLMTIYGAILYYLQRPRVRWSFSATAAMVKQQPIPTPPPAGTTPTWVLVTSITGAILVCIALFITGLVSLVEKSFRSSTAFAMALDRAQASPCVARTFGQPIVAKGFISGNLNTNNDSGEAELEIPIHGPRTAGNLHVEAKKSAGLWTLNSLSAEHSNGQIQLAPTPSPCD